MQISVPSIKQEIADVLQATPLRRVKTDRTIIEDAIKACIEGSILRLLSQERVGA